MVTSRVSVYMVLLAFLAIAAKMAGAAPTPVTAPPPPVVAIPGGVTHLDDIGLYSVSYHYLDGRSGTMPVGWTGHFEDQTGISITPFGTQAGKSAFLIHPIWRNGTGDTDQEFRLALPRAKKITLHFSIAMQEGQTGPGKSDGATFRLFLNGRKLLDKNKTDSAWAPYSFDLTPESGHTVALRFETDPGPKHDSSFDFALWGNREISDIGAPLTAPSPITKHSYPLTGRTSAWGGASPTFAPGDTILTPIGRRPHGILDQWAFWPTKPQPKGKPAAHENPIGIGAGAYLDLVEPGGKIVRSDSPEVHASVVQTQSPHGVHRAVTYSLSGRTIRVAADLYYARGSTARVDIRSDDPYIAAVHFGDIGPVAFRRQIVIPYLGQISYLPDLGLFAKTIVDYTLSHAGALDGTTARYGALTDGRRRPVRETAYYALSPDLHAVLPTAPNPASPYRAPLGKHIILDVWGGSFTDNAAWLKELSTYGLTELDTIVHDWQNGGYDNKLPNVLPANPNLGGDAGMKVWAHTAVNLGEIFGLHENYVDFYPNAAVYTTKDVAHDSQNHLIPAWKNLIQSYAVAPTAILKYARMFTPEVQRRFGENGGYLDVHSAVPPWFHVDFRADVPGAGEFRTVFNAHRDLWKLFRKVHGGPVLGEGNNHWYWSGLLDGVEAQFGQGVPSNGGQTAPLMVDFDLLKIHPLQLNHGMGYLERWLAAGYSGDWGSRIPAMKTLDQYRMQEIAYGHAGFVAAPLAPNLPFIWQEQNLVIPVTDRYATAQPVSIQYELNGRMLDTNAAAAAGSAFDRVRIQYDDGLVILANSRDADWHVGGGKYVLPQYGWMASGDGLTAYTAERDGVVVDYARTPASLFVNARTTVVTPERQLDVTPSVARFEQAGPRQFRITYAWRVGDPIPKGEAIFIHVTGAGAAQPEGIIFQPPSGIAAAPDRWPVGKTTVGDPVDVTLPAGMPDGSYEIKTGLYAPDAGGGRLALGGKNDGDSRIILGTLIVSDNGSTLRFQPTPAQPDLAAANRARILAHTNPNHKLVDFGVAATDGSFLLQRERAGSWTLTPFPRNTRFTIALNPPAIDGAFKSLHVEALNVNNRPVGPVAIHPAPKRGRGWVEFQANTIPGAVRYRLERPGTGATDRSRRRSGKGMKSMRKAAK